MSTFVQINGDIFNVDKIQSITYEDQKNCLGKDSGVYILHIYMENNIGSQHKAYSNKKKRDDDFKNVLDKLKDFGIRHKTRELSKEV